MIVRKSVRREATWLVSPRIAPMAYRPHGAAFKHLIAGSVRFLSLDASQNLKHVIHNCGSVRLRPVLYLLDLQGLVLIENEMVVSDCLQGGRREQLPVRGVGQFVDSR